jgi:hypothetical protein
MPRAGFSPGAAIFADALLGLVLHRALPDPHFSAESKDVEGEGRIDRGA